MLFRRKKRRGGPRIRGGKDDVAPRDGQELHLIEFDMMIKGSICKRPTGEVRQFAVTVNGATRVVTSGETVDRKTYEALLEDNALRIPPTRDSEKEAYPSSPPDALTDDSDPAPKLREEGSQEN